MIKFIIKETKESFNSIHELRQHALFEQIENYTLIVREDKKMTEGISKQRLQLIIRRYDHDKEHIDHEELTDLADLLLEECTELDPWLPIESAPLNRKIILFNIAAKSQVFDSCLYTEAFRKYYSHWKELPEDPKE